MYFWNSLAFSYLRNKRCMQYRLLTGKIGWKENRYRRMWNQRNFFSEMFLDSPGGAVVKTPYSQCKRSGFNHWSCILCSVASIVSNSVRPYGLQPTRFLCPWLSPGKNTGGVCRALLQRIFPILGSNPRLLCLSICIGRWVLYHQHHLGSLNPWSGNQIPHAATETSTAK